MYYFVVQNNQINYLQIKYIVILYELAIIKLKKGEVCMKKIISIILATLLVVSLGIVFTSATTTSAENVAAGKSYTCTGAASDGSYPDTDSKELTDGTTGVKADIGYAPDLWTGLNWKGADAVCDDEEWIDTTVAINTIVVDLGSVTDKLTGFSIITEDCGNGIAPAKEVEVFVSDDKADFTSIGKTTSTKTIDYGDSTTPDYGIYNLTLNTTAKSARYVKFVVYHKSSWCFVSEVEVYQDSDASDESSEESKEEKPAESYSLISFDASKWLLGDECNGETAKVDASGDAIVVSGSSTAWPYAHYSIENPVTVNIADFELVYDFTISGGKANIALFCEGSTVIDNNNYIDNVTHLMAEEGSTQRPLGDDLTADTYTGKIKLSDLDLTNVTVLEDGKLQISALKVYSVGGGVITINKFAIESIATVFVDTSDDESSDESSVTSSDTSSVTSSEAVSDTSIPNTGDSGMISFAIVALIAVISLSAFAMKKRTSK